jgi:hypothetical protein
MQRYPRGTPRHMKQCIVRDRRGMKKSWRNLEYTLGERNPTRVWRSQGVGDPNLLETEGILWRSKITLGEPWPPQERSGEDFVGLGFEGVHLLYIARSPIPKHVRAWSRICLGQKAGHVRLKLPWQFRKVQKLPKKSIIKGFWHRVNSNTYIGHK